MQKEYALEVGGRTLSVSFPNWAEQTNGSALVRYGDTVVLATTVMGKQPREGIDFFPLMVEYQEKFYAAGRIRGSRFIKREARPSDDAILTGRMIDRALRPRFDQRMRNDVQITLSVLSVDGANDPDIPAFIAASLSLLVSDIPWDGPVSAVCVGRVDGKWIINPTNDLTPKTDVDSASSPQVEVIVASTEGRINMLEAGASQVSEEEMAEAIEFGHRANAALIDFQKTIQKEMGRAKAPVTLLEPDDALVKEIRAFTEGKLEAALFQELKQERMEAVVALRKELAEELKQKYPEDKLRREIALSLLEEEINRLVHEKALRGVRVDGRKPDELRSVSASVGFLPRTHGSGLFARGMTHVLSVCTLGAPGDSQIVEEMGGEYKKRFMLHYNFPGFSVGEATPNRGPSRREIGHGALAERALVPVIPNVEDFPYTIRVVSETLSSNGSSSQASATSASLALMDAGVPIKEPVAGIAIGLMMAPDGSAQVLTDIQGPEDHHGDMDFKVAGTKNGVTAIQMDVKIEGITIEILKEALRHGKKARMEILAATAQAIEKPRATLSPYAPLVQVLKIRPDKIRLVIGAGGKTINEIIADTNTKIDIEDDGTVFVTAHNQTDGKRAIERIESLTHETKIGEMFQARVVKIADFGAFVEYLPGQEGLVHVSELASTYVKNVEDIVKIGDIIPVKVTKIDEQGKVGLSRKQAMLETPKHNPY